MHSIYLLHHQNKKNIKIDNAKDIAIVMPMYNLLEYRNNYYKAPEIYDNTTGINHF